MSMSKSTNHFCRADAKVTMFLSLYTLTSNRYVELNAGTSFEFFISNSFCSKFCELRKYLKCSHDYFTIFRTHWMEEQMIFIFKHHLLCKMSL